MGSESAITLVGRIEVSSLTAQWTHQLLPKGSKAKASVGRWMHLERNRGISHEYWNGIIAWINSTSTPQTPPPMSPPEWQKIIHPVSHPSIHCLHTGWWDMVGQAIIGVMGQEKVMKPLLGQKLLRKYVTVGGTLPPSSHSCCLDIGRAVFPSRTLKLHLCKQLGERKREAQM